MTIQNVWQSNLVDLRSPEKGHKTTSCCVSGLSARLILKACNHEQTQKAHVNVEFPLCTIKVLNVIVEQVLCDATGYAKQDITSENGSQKRGVPKVRLRRVQRLDRSKPSVGTRDQGGVFKNTRGIRTRSGHWRPCFTSPYHCIPVPSTGSMFGSRLMSMQLCRV